MELGIDYFAGVKVATTALSYFPSVSNSSKLNAKIFIYFKGNSERDYFL